MDDKRQLEGQIVKTDFMC